MKFVSTLALTAAAVCARPDPKRPLVSRYELSLSANAADAPYTNGPVSLRDNAAGFYATQTEPLVIEVHEDAGQEVQLAVSSEGFLALDGEGGLRDLVLVGEEQGAGRSGFSLEPREGGERLYNVTWGGQGRWYVQSIGDDNYQLKWWDGEGFTVATVFPVQLVGKLTAQA